MALVKVPMTEMPGAAGVEAQDLRAAHPAGHAAVAALVDDPVAVDEEVVAHVAPVHRLGVVGVHAADDRRSLRGLVGVAAVGVVDERHLDGRVGGRPGAPRLVRAPLLAGDDPGLGGHGAGRRREVDAGHRRRGATHHAGERRRRVGVLGGVDGDDTHVAQERGRRVRAGLPGRQLDVATRARPDGLGARLHGTALFGHALELDVVPAAPRPAVLARAKQDGDGSAASRRRAGDAQHGEVHAGVHGDRAGHARPRPAAAALACEAAIHRPADRERRRQSGRTQLDGRRAHPLPRLRAHARRGPHGGERPDQAQGAQSREMRGALVGVGSRHGAVPPDLGFRQGSTNPLDGRPTGREAALAAAARRTRRAASRTRSGRRGSGPRRPLQDAHAAALSAAARATASAAPPRRCPPSWRACRSRLPSPRSCSSRWGCRGGRPRWRTGPARPAGR